MLLLDRRIIDIIIDSTCYILIICHSHRLLTRLEIESTQEQREELIIHCGIGNRSSQFLFRLTCSSLMIAVLSYGIDTVATNLTLNSSVVAEICGANFCGASNEETENPNLQPPPIERIYLISGIYLGCMILACLIIAFGVDSLTRYNRAFTRTAEFFMEIPKNVAHDGRLYCRRGFMCAMLYRTFYFVDTTETVRGR